MGYFVKVVDSINIYIEDNNLISTKTILFIHG